MYSKQTEANLGVVTLSTKIKMRDSEDKKNHENLLAFASITLTTDLGTLTISGFRIWKSKFDDFKGYNVTVPMAGLYKQVFASKALMLLIQKNVGEAYEYASIPAIW